MWTITPSPHSTQPPVVRLGSPTQTSLQSLHHTLGHTLQLSHAAVVTHTIDQCTSETRDIKKIITSTSRQIRHSEGGRSVAKCAKFMHFDHRIPSFTLSDTNVIIFLYHRYQSLVSYGFKGRQIIECFPDDATVLLIIPWPRAGP